MAWKRNSRVEWLWVEVVLEGSQAGEVERLSGRVCLNFVSLLRTHSAVKMPKPNSGLTKEEEILLTDFGRNVTAKYSAIFYTNAFLVSVIPIWLFWRVHLMEPLDSAIVFVVGSLISTYLVAFAYKNTKFLLKHKVASKREDAVTKEMSKKLSEDKKMPKNEKDHRVLWKINEVADYEATTFAIFFNNAIFVAVLIIASTYVLRSFSPSVNYLLSMGVASGLIALLSTGSK
ncbi:unnamed protein product [Notodromas monacha]|uniref:Translocon-associated protein subunit gamma n=1 Tax=Notodromas monacha TaxID=399045 RepID=A0A7R9G8W5_9CRUS|nr:unnamed protein product [Notodromas monacha]CAG0913641.1 unnamed protein product [Notodromas monacha]